MAAACGVRGIDIEHIRAVNPHIVYARGSGQGVRGPDAERGGYDGASYWARGGIAMALTGAGSEDPPVMQRPAFGDSIGGMTVAGGIAAALFRRERTGKPSVVDISLLGAAMWNISADITMAKALAAIGMGVLGGFVTLAVFGGRDLGSLLKELGGGGCSGDLRSERVAWAFWREPARRSEFAAEARVTGWFLAKWLTMAFVLESLMVAYLPAGAVGAWVGGGNWWAVPAAVLVGVPACLNGYAAIPTVSGLMGLGMTPGAAMAFMVAGAATCIPAAVAVAALVRAPVFALYVGLGAAGALAAGFAYGGLVSLWPVLAP